MELSEALDRFEYDPTSGEIRYRKDSSVRNKNAGELATFKHKSSGSYVRLKLRVGNRHFMAHRIAWLIFYGEKPNGMIDHINGNPLDNRICNLRIATSRENQLNRVRGTSLYKNNKHGLAGLYYVNVSGKYKWRVKSFNLGVSEHVGYFDSKLDACCAIMRKKAGN